MSLLRTGSVVQPAETIMTTPDFDLKQAHRWFAVEFNNQAWDLVEAKHRTAQQAQDMIHLAHAARYHWQHAGTEINTLRGDILVATAYATAKQGENCLSYAQLAAQNVVSIPAATAFDRACIQGCLALGRVIAKQAVEASQSITEFEHAMSEIDEAAERELLLQLYPVLNHED